MTPTAHPKTPTAPPAETQTQDRPLVSVFATMTYAEGRALFYQMEERRMHQEGFGV